MRRFGIRGNRKGVIGSLASRSWTLALIVGQLQVVEEYNLDLVPGLLALASAIEIYLSITDEPSWFLLKFQDSIVYNLGHSKTSGALLLHILRFWCHIKTSAVTMEWVLLLLKRHQTDIIVMVRTCFKFRVLWNRLNLLPSSE